MKKLIDSDILNTSAKVWKDEDDIDYNSRMIEVGNGQWPINDSTSGGPIVKLRDDLDSDYDFFIPTFIYPDGILSGQINWVCTDESGENTIEVSMDSNKISVNGGIYRSEPAAIDISKTVSSGIYTLTLSSKESLRYKRILLDVQAVKSASSTFAASVILDMDQLGVSTTYQAFVFPYGAASNNYTCRVAVSGNRSNYKEVTVEVMLDQITFDTGYTINFNAKVI